MEKRIIKDRKPVSMRRYQRSRAKAEMEREGIRRVNSRNQSDGIKDRYQSYFALHWKKAAKITLRKKRA